MNKCIKLILIFLLALPVCIPAAVTIKIGSIAPARSPWDKSLHELNREWIKISRGQVRLKIYPGGIAGNEDDMIRKMRMGILGGAVLSNRGIKKLNRDVYVLNIPFLFENDAELKYVLDKLKPEFEKEIEKQGFKIIIWSMSGWVNFFSKKPVSHPNDLRKAKISFTTGEPLMEQAWKKSGYNVIPNDLKDLMMGLQSGMVDAFYLPPLLAGSGQYFAQAPHMCDLRVSPLLGGVVLSNRIWRRIPEEFRSPMQAAAFRLSQKLLKQTDKLEREAMVTMKEHGLKVHHVDSSYVKEWRSVAARGVEILVEKAFSREIYEKILRLINEFRNQKNEH